MPAKRNPYYWKVDPEGNQLPYIDEIVFTQIQNTEIGNIKAMNGEVDFQARFMNSQHFTMFMLKRERGDYYVLHDEILEILNFLRSYCIIIFIIDFFCCTLFYLCKS